MKISTIALIMITIVSLALSVVLGVVSIVVLLGAAKKSVDEIDFSKYSQQVEEWIDENINEDIKVDTISDGEAVSVQIGTDGVHVDTGDQSVDVGLGGISVNG